MSNQDHAAQLLSHYMREAWQAAGLRWESDHYAEMETAVESIIGAAREGMQARPASTDAGEPGTGPVIRIQLAGVPAQCPHCHVPAAFPLAVFGHRVQAVCPACDRKVADVAVTSEDDRATMAPRCDGTGRATALASLASDQAEAWADGSDGGKDR